MSAAALQDALQFWPVWAAGLGNAYLCLLAAGVLFFTLSSGALAFKYAPLLYHDLQRRSGNSLPAWLIAILTGLLLFWPILPGGGPLWLALWWQLLFWCYLRSTERWLAYGLAGFVAVSGLLAFVAGGCVTYAANQAGRELFTVESDIATPQDIQRLEAFAAANPADAEALNALAITAIQRAEYRRAIDLIKKALRQSPNNPRYLNHLGVALAGLKQPAAAAKAFESSMATDATNPIYAYNLSRLELAEFHFYESEKAVKAASKLDAPRTRRLLESEKHAARQSFVIAPMAVPEHLKRQFKSSPLLQQAADGIWRLLVGLLPRSAAPLLAAGFVVLLLALRQVPADRVSKTCCRCGKVHYVGGLSAKGLPQCMQCNWLDNRKDRSESTVSKHKTEDIRDFRKRQAARVKLCEKLLPGLGMLLAERSSLAFRRLLLFSLGLTLLLSGGAFIGSFIPDSPDLTAGLRSLGGLILALLYWRGWRFKPARS